MEYARVTEELIRFEVDLPRQWERIDLIRRSVCLCVEATLGNRSLGDAVSMASAELLENAIKHGADGPGIGFALGIDGNHLIVRVENRIKPETETLTTLLRIVKAIQTSGDPAALEELFFARVLAVADHGDDGDGLGLYRVAHEGGGRLWYSVDDSRGEVAVSAEFQIT